MPEDNTNDVMKKILEKSKVSYELKSTQKPAAPAVRAAEAAQPAAKAEAAQPAAKAEPEIQPVVDATTLISLQSKLVQSATDLVKRTDLTALGRTVVLKRIEGIAETIRKELLLGTANIEYRQLQLLNPGVKALALEGAMLQKYTPKAEYIFPAEIQALEERLKSEKAVAIELKTAKKVDKEIDINTSTLFTVKV